MNIARIVYFRLYFIQNGNNRLFLFHYHQRNISFNWIFNTNYYYIYSFIVIWFIIFSLNKFWFVNFKVFLLYICRIL